MKADKKYCTGCRDDYYNHDNNSTTRECWMFERAKVINAYVIGWWTAMDKKENFYRQTTHDCHSEPGQRAFLKELPAHLKQRTGMTVTITKDDGELTEEELQAIGRMIEEGYRQGYGSPYGLTWDTEVENS